MCKRANDHSLYDKRRMLKRNISSLKQQISLCTVEKAREIQKQIKELERELFNLDRKRNHV